MGGQTADQSQHQTPFILSFRSAMRGTAQPVQVGTDDADCPKPEQTATQVRQNLSSSSPNSSSRRREELSYQYPPNIPAQQQWTEATGEGSWRRRRGEEAARAMNAHGGNASAQAPPASQGGKPGAHIHQAATPEAL
jgi:hypothetical protein